MVSVVQDEDFPGSIPHFLCFVLDHFSANPAITPINATAGQSVSFCLCWGARAISWPHCDDLVLLFHQHLMFFSFVLFVVQHNFLFTLMIFLSFAISCTHTCCSQGWMMFWIGWSKSHRSLLVFFLDLAIPPTSTDESDIGEPGGGCVPRKRIKRRELGERVRLGDSFYLGPQMLQQNPVISIAKFVARTCQCLLMVTTRFCGTSRAANTFRATNVWGWRHQTGNCLTMRGTSWVQLK